ncbi:MAG: response regulator transcription factor [Streptococcaceae bacterium]|jgi:DNA-binding response OmpR family regulator|nr:response regulator transcription factor [Streptococcaceae bacterium]
MAKILIIEDNDDIQEILRKLFQTQYEVFSAYSGTEGLLLFKQTQMDLVLLDIMLPGKSGDQVLADLRELSDLPIIMMTALGEKQRISQYLLAGANDYVVKPFDLDELAARVAVQLRTKSSQAETKSLSYKRLQLNSDDFTLNSDTKSLRLSRLEFDILSLLIKNPKQIFTKEHLYEAVWQETYLPGDNTLNTHLSHLRHKIAELDPENDYIETIWGLGVRMAGDKK